MRSACSPSNRLARAVLTALAALVACHRPQPPGPVAFDFAASFDLAIIDRETADIVFGTSAARRHLGEGWSIDETTPDGKPFTWSEGEESSLEFFLARPRRLVVRLRCEPLTRPGLPPQTLAVAVNGHELVVLQLEPGRRRYQVSVPVELLLAGANRLVFRYGHTHAPGDDGASPDRRRLAVVWYELGFGTPGESGESLPGVEREGGQLRIPVGTQVAYHLRVPDHSILAAESVSLGAAGAAELAVLVQPEGEAEREVARIPRSTRTWSVPLAVDAGKVARIAFRARTTTAGALGGSVRLERPTLRLRPAPDRLPAASAAPSAPRPHVFIYLVDTLRADHLGCYGYHKPVSPELDAFARQATVLRGIAPSSWTKASVASLLTGRSPIDHRAQDRGDTLVPEAVTLSERLGAAGYRTYALYANSWVSETFGLDQGFEEKRFLLGRSDRLNRELFRRLGRLSPGERLFAYVHTVDPHAPYEPAPEFRRRFAPPGGTLTRVSIEFLEDLARRRRRGQQVSPRLVAEIEALYDAEIAFNDRQFGLFLAELKRLGLYDDALVIFTSDHGEEFLEHGSVSHGQTLFREVLEVPLVVKWPRGVAAPPVSSGSAAQLLDVLPTVLDCAGLPVPPDLEGRSLLRPPEAIRPEGSGILSYLHLDGLRLQAVSQDRWKLIRSGPLEDSRAPVALFDLDRGTETADVKSEHPVMASHLESQLRSAILRRPTAPSPPQADIPPEVVERLRALGYLR